MNPEHEIGRNYPWSEGYVEESFWGQLHEDGRWNDNEFWKLDAAVYLLNDSFQGEGSLPRQITKQIVFIFSDVIRAISCHYDQNDVYFITNLTQDQLHERSERLWNTLVGFTAGEMVSNTSYESPNPFLSSPPA